MHTHIAVALLAPIDWSFVIHHSPARIIAIAAAVYAFLQGVKQFIPLLTGWRAIAANVLLSAAGILAVTPADQLLTPGTMSALVVAILTAAGIHGTVSKLSADASPSSAAGSSPSSSAGQAIAGKKGLAILLAVGASLSVMTLAGCNDFERTTYQTLSASQAVINQAQADYEATTIAKTQAAYDAINKAKALQVLAVQAMAAYKTIEDTKGTQSALAAQQQVVQSFVNQLPALVAAVKALYTSSPATLPKPIAKPLSMLRWEMPAAA